MHCKLLNQLPPDQFYFNLSFPYTTLSKTSITELKTSAIKTISKNLSGYQFSNCLQNQCTSYSNKIIQSTDAAMGLCNSVKSCQYQGMSYVTTNLPHKTVPQKTTRPKCMGRLNFYPRLRYWSHGQSWHGWSLKMNLV